MLSPKDDRTRQALKRLTGDSDFEEFMGWLEYSLHELDQTKRLTTDGVQLRMQQGAAQAIAEIVEAVRGRTKAIASVSAKTHAE